jgi:hypothetical protein
VSKEESIELEESIAGPSHRGCDSYLMYLDNYDNENIKAKVNHLLAQERLQGKNAHLYFIDNSPTLYYLYLKDGELQEPEKINQKLEKEKNIQAVIQRLKKQYPDKKALLFFKLSTENVQDITLNTSHTPHRTVDAFTIIRLIKEGGFQLPIFSDDIWDKTFTVNVAMLLAAIDDEERREKIARLLTTSEGLPKEIQNVSILHLAVLFQNELWVKLTIEQFEIKTSTGLRPIDFALLDKDIEQYILDNPAKLVGVIPYPNMQMPYPNTKGKKPQTGDEACSNAKLNALITAIKEFKYNNVEGFNRFLDSEYYDWTMPTQILLGAIEDEGLKAGIDSKLCKTSNDGQVLDAIHNMTPLHLAALLGNGDCIFYLVDKYDKSGKFSVETDNGFLPIDLISPDDYYESADLDPETKKQLKNESEIIKSKLHEAISISKSSLKLNELSGAWSRYSQQNITREKKFKYAKMLSEAIRVQLAELGSLRKYVDDIRANCPTDPRAMELERFAWLSVCDTASHDNWQSKINRIVERHRRVQQIVKELQQEDPKHRLKGLRKCVGVFACGLIGIIILMALAIGIYGGLTVICPPAGLAIAGIIAVAGITKSSLVASAVGFVFGFLPSALRGKTLFFPTPAPEKFLKASKKAVENKENADHANVSENGIGVM